MATGLSTAPILSTPDDHILRQTDDNQFKSHSVLSDEQIGIRYEIERTLNEIKQHRWRRVALQFPDSMLNHSARVHHLLSQGLRCENDEVIPEARLSQLNVNDTTGASPVKLTILADTSYGSCCVDEIAAEHADADAVIHYGRSCLSPSARLPVVHVFTKSDLDYGKALESFMQVFADLSSKVIVTADTSYADHIPIFTSSLVERGYSNCYAANIVHDPSSIIPNRELPDTLKKNLDDLHDWCLFHIAEPPTALLLTLASRVKSIEIYRPDTCDSSVDSANTSLLLRRRYALVTSMATVSAWGILINTLSVKNYLHIVEHIKARIAAAGRKSYLFVVGKLNAAKIANFSEIGGWVVVGCWESSLVDSKDFFKPILTPFELDLALASDDYRIWTGAWRSDFQSVLDGATASEQEHVETGDDYESEPQGADTLSLDSEEEESAPPEFDLRTGRYVSHSRPTPRPHGTVRSEDRNVHKGHQSKELTKSTSAGSVAVNGLASPAAEYLTQKRTWKGLGSEFEVRYEDEEVEGSLVEQGSIGTARGYIVGDSEKS